MADPAHGCGLATAAFAADTAVAAVNAAIGPDVGLYSVVLTDADGSADGPAGGGGKEGGCRVEADMANEGGSVGECRLVDGTAFAVVACPVGRVPVGLACVAVDADNNSAPVRGTTQATMLHTAQCGFPVPVPAPFSGDRAVIVMACQPVELHASSLQGKKGAGGQGGAWPSGGNSVAALLAKAGTGGGANKAAQGRPAAARAAAVVAAAKAAPAATQRP